MVRFNYYFFIDDYRVRIDIDYIIFIDDYN